MIFPDLPKHYTWQQHSREPNIAHTTVETPLRGNENTTGSSRITVEEWWIKHGLAIDPAATPTHSTSKEPINWWGRDAVEFYLLCTGMLCWITYWYGVHHGAW